MIETGIVEKRWPLTPRDSRVPAWKDAPGKEWEARRMAVFAAQVDRLDRNIGRILSTVRQKGIEENTLILFLADNGGCAEEITPRWGQTFIPKTTRDGRPMHVGNVPSVMPGPEDTYQSYGIRWANASNTPFRLYKHWIHEGGISTPLIASWPGHVRKPGSLTHQPGHIIDLMTTCVDAGHAEYPAGFNGHRIKPMEGSSLVPVIEGRQRKQPVVYWEHEGNKAVRDGKWKLVSKFPGTWELYDLEADRTEMNTISRPRTRNACGRCPGCGPGGPHAATCGRGKRCARTPAKCRSVTVAARHHYRTARVSERRDCSKATN